VNTYECESFEWRVRIRAVGPSQAAEEFACSMHKDTECVKVKVTPVSGGEVNHFDVAVKRTAVAKLIRDV
jgi:hypothetical protein